LWNIVVYPVEGRDFTASIDVLAQSTDLEDYCQTFRAPCQLRLQLWMVSYYGSSSQCSLLRDNGVNVAGSPPLNRKRVPQLVQSKKVAKGGPTSAECNGIMEFTSKHTVTTEALL
jgi:hypothetical protein